MEIRIETTDQALSADLMSIDAVEFEHGVSLRYGGQVVCEASGIPDIIVLIATVPMIANVPMNVGVSVIVNWIWEHLKGRDVTGLEIDRTIVEFDKGEITRVILEHIAKHEAERCVKVESDDEKVQGCQKWND